MINDGSTDNSGKICDSYACDDERIRVVHKENEGVSKARNTALEKAQGDYISFVDSDDFIDKNFYMTLIREFTEDDLDIVTCGFCEVFGEKICPVKNIGNVPNEKMLAKDFLRYVYERDTFRGVSGYLWTKLIKSSLIKGIDGRLLLKFDDDLSYGEDVIFNAEIMLRAGMIKYINKQLYFYFQREGSAAHCYSGQIKSLDWIKAYETVIDKMKVSGIDRGIVDLIVRIYVYRCGRLLEKALEYGDAEKSSILKKKIKSNLQIYVKTNTEHLERVVWIKSLLD